MTVQVEALNEDRNQTRWQSIKKWLSAFEEGMDYDPQEHLNAVIKDLWQKVEQLETRLSELDGRDQSAVRKRAS